MHLCAMYMAAVVGLPGVKEALQPLAARPTLEALGLWDVNVVRCMVPPLALHLLVQPTSPIDLYATAKVRLYRGCIHNSLAA